MNLSLLYCSYYYFILIIYIFFSFEWDSWQERLISKIKKKMELFQTPFLTIQFLPMKGSPEILEYFLVLFQIFFPRFVILLFRKNWQKMESTSNLWKDGIINVGAIPVLPMTAPKKREKSFSFLIRIFGTPFVQNSESS